MHLNWSAEAPPNGGPRAPTPWRRSRPTRSPCSRGRSARRSTSGQRTGTSPPPPPRTATPPCCARLRFGDRVGGHAIMVDSQPMSARDCVGFKAGAPLQSHLAGRATRARRPRARRAGAPACGVPQRRRSARPRGRQTRRRTGRGATRERGRGAAHPGRWRGGAGVRAGGRGGVSGPALICFESTATGAIASA